MSIKQKVREILEKLRKKEGARKEPYFLKNPRWYIKISPQEAEELGDIEYVLRDVKMPLKARVSYVKYANQLYVMDSDTGEIMVEISDSFGEFETIMKLFNSDFY